MVKSKIKSLVILFMIMIMILTGTSIAADYTCKVSILGNKSEIKRGDAVTLLVKATDIQAGEGIASFSTSLEYDSDVFSCEVSGEEAWEKTSFFEGALFMNRGDYVANSGDQVIAKIILTAKSNAPIGNQTIRLSGIEFSTGSETFSVDDVSCNIAITNDSSFPSGDGNTTGGNSSSGNGNTTGGNSSSGNGNTTGGGSSSGNGNTIGGGSSSGNGNTTGGGSSSGNGNTTGGSSSSGNRNTIGGGTSGSSRTNSNGSGSSISNVSPSNSSIPKTGVTDILIIGAIIGTLVSVVFYIKYKRTY